jgi:hypothetical protein
MAFQRVLLLAAAMLIAACSQAPAPIVDPAAEATRLMQLELEWMEALHSGDIDAAMAYDRGKSSVALPDGSVLDGNYMVVWVRENGDWKAAVDMVN